ncbi:trafficking protein particle complex subunit 10 [Episyrphus balteatus]|uniref:trafficking protein particle complex subunit 10 n=1 Tax=Episyrphus balteatus TaxID=286459 RepID=UPI0024859FF0|nr:trafficking protein particle complex subunit 10 [Episyrphus balteatus]
MNIKPIITYSGAGPLFRSLENNIVSTIPNDTCEWRRAYHLPPKQVRLEATVQPLNYEALEKYKKGNWSILEHPILHIFTTECGDLDTYKSTTREEIDTWLKKLASYGVSDWMILLVETFDAKKTKNILPRTTVLDKIRLDFCSKNDDRCISVLNPAKQKSTESFRCLVQRIRYLMLSSYTRNITKYEELIRVSREKRNQDGWDFRKYFFLQEDLALIFEKLELYSDALVQYDELDAIFSQFITNSGFGEKQKWLEHFKQPLSSFHGICLSRKNKFEMRERIRESAVSILEFRNYLFERQSHLLQISNLTPEIAERLLNFLFSTLREIEVIKVDCQEGALQCWEFVCAREVLQICDQAMEPDEVICFQHCAPIWNLAKDKLYELGKLCGLLPGFTPTSEQLHIVVNLSAGIGDNPLEQEFLNPTPQIDMRAHSPNRKPKECPAEQLKKALGSNQAFQKLYLELSELAISTYKHVSRLRSARLAGLDLGNFYCALNEPHKAVVFFTDLLRELKAENWNYLASQTLLELASCYRKMDDHLAYTKTCGAISCCQDLEMLVRTFYFDEFLKCLRTLKANLTVQSMENTANFCVLEDHFKICEIIVTNVKPIIQDDIVQVHVKVESLFPREVFVENVSISFELNSADEDVLAEVALPNMQQKLKVSLNLSYKQDNTLESASVAYEKVKKTQPVRRTSSTKRKLSPAVQSDFQNFVVAEGVPLHPGMNIIEMKTKATRVGIWIFKQMSIRLNQLQFLSDKIPFKVTPFEITTKPASAVLSFKNLIAGIIQPVRLIVSGGSFIFPSEAKINLSCSKHMRVRLSNEPEADFESTLSVPLANFKSFEEREIPLEVITKLPGSNIVKQCEHRITLGCPWSRNELTIPLDFMPAMTASYRLHTCGTQKFVQVLLKGVNAELVLSDAHVNCEVPGVYLQDLNPTTQKEIRICKNLTVSYLWGIQMDWNADIGASIKIEFKVKYSDYARPGALRDYSYSFDLSDYTTLFKVQAQLEPNELCRLRSVCNMNLKITKLRDNKFADLMYEVLTDHMWAVCGQSAGVVSMKDVESHSISLDVMPLSTGFLPMPSIRLSQYKTAHSKVVPFAVGQIYNSTKSMQIHVMASNNGD